MAVKRSKAGQGVPYRSRSRRNTRIEWHGEKRTREGAAGLAVMAWLLVVGAWRWSYWSVLIITAPFIFIGYLAGLLLIVGPLCLVLVCIGKPRVALEVIREIPLVPTTLRQVLVPPRTGLAQRAFRAVTRRW